jgi:hypothetical protein
MTMQPDLLAATEEDLSAEIRRHGGGTPPRFLAPAEEDDDDEGAREYYSPVQYAEAINRRERDHNVVSIAVIPLDRMVEYVEKRGML